MLKIIGKKAGFSQNTHKILWVNYAKLRVYYGKLRLENYGCRLRVITSKKPAFFQELRVNYGKLRVITRLRKLRV